MQIYSLLKQVVHVAATELQRISNFRWSILEMVCIFLYIVVKKWVKTFEGLLIKQDSKNKYKTKKIKSKNSVKGGLTAKGECHVCLLLLLLLLCLYACV
jgi:hypothetical protein